MRSLALLTVLIFHATGLWPHLSAQTRQNVTTAANHSAVAPTVPSQLLVSAGVALPIQTSNSLPSLESRSSILALDEATGTPLYVKAGGVRRPIASVTKLVTAIVVLSRHRADEIVTIGKLPAYLPEDDTLGFTTGEKYRLGDLVSAALIASANDAADALAIYDAGSINRFAAQMNLKMGEWGIADTHFVSPSGLVDDNNYATALALGKIASLALTSPLIKDAVSHNYLTISSLAGRTLSATSTNKLLASGQFYGIKTGYTLRAGECFVGLTKVNGHDVITVVLGSSDRFGETQALTNWIGSSWVWL